MSYTNVESRPGQQSRHGQVFKPESRGQLCVDGVNAQCPLQSWQVNGLEGGKFFPAIAGGLRDPLAPDDVANVAPPADGKIASAGQAFAAVLDEQSAERWHKHPVKSGQTQEFHWSYHAVHLTRRWFCWIPRTGRAQFVHSVIEGGTWETLTAGWEIDRRSFMSHEDLDAHLRGILPTGATIAMVASLTLARPTNATMIPATVPSRPT